MCLFVCVRACVRVIIFLSEPTDLTIGPRILGIVSLYGCSDGEVPSTHVNFLKNAPFPPKKGKNIFLAFFRSAISQKLLFLGLLLFYAKTFRMVDLYYKKNIDSLGPIILGLQKNGRASHFWIFRSSNILKISWKRLLLGVLSFYTKMFKMVNLCNNFFFCVHRGHPLPLSSKKVRVNPLNY